MNLKLSLAGIERRYLDIYQHVVENDGELDEAMIEELTINENEFEDRLQTFSCIINSALSEIDYINRIKETLTKKLVQRANFIEFLEQTIINTTKKIVVPDKTKAGLDTFKIEFKSGFKVNLIPSQSVEIMDEKEIEELGLGKYKVTITVKDKKIVDSIQTDYPEAQAVFNISKTEVGEKIEDGSLDNAVAFKKVKHRLKITI